MDRVLYPPHRTTAAAAGKTRWVKLEPAKKKKSAHKQRLGGNKVLLNGPVQRSDPLSLFGQNMQQALTGMSKVLLSKNNQAVGACD